MRRVLQFVIDPLVLKFNKGISAQRDQIKQLIDAHQGRQHGFTDVFVVVGRSLVAATDARFDRRAILNQVMSSAAPAVAAGQGTRGRQDYRDTEKAEAARAAIMTQLLRVWRRDYENRQCSTFCSPTNCEYKLQVLISGNFFIRVMSGVVRQR